MPGLAETVALELLFQPQRGALHRLATVSEESKRNFNLADTPIAYGVQIDFAVDREALARLTSPYAKSSPAECYLGPGWVSDTGIATFIVITHNARWVSEIKRAGQCAMLAWRWDAAIFVPADSLGRWLSDRALRNLSTNHSRELAA